jgi:exonuclease SbcC
MRPVLLELDGFASYRSKATVDFRDTDFFVLVGPTGSGKSTIIDAMVFALYGTAPRWDDRSAVAPALAPTANRAVVRLIFDVGGKRYAAVRDVRRSGGRNPTVSVREARLEQFVSADALGAPDDDTDPMATGRAVSPAVEKLLGLSFDQFTQSVALPQGEFARFLHATDGDRQDILKNLLGYGIYDDIQRAAHTRASDNKLRADTLAEQLEGYEDATAENVDSLSRSLDAVKDLQTQVNTASVPALKAATDEAAASRARADQLKAERKELLAISIPDGVDELDSEKQARTAAVTSAKAAQEQVEDRDRKARSALQAAPPRHELEQTVHNWVELHQIESQLPTLEKDADSAEADLATATQTRTLTATALDETRNKSADARQAADHLERQIAEARASLGSLRTVRTPDGVRDVAQAVRDAANAVSEANARLTSAEAVQRTAMKDLEGAPNSAALAAAASDAHDVRTILHDDKTAAPQRANAEALAKEAQQGAAQAARDVSAAEQALRDAEHADRAAAIRADLKVGDDCPVCGQPVVEIPSATGTVDLVAARAQVQAAKARAEDATAEASRMEADHNKSITLRTDRLHRCDSVRVRLLEQLSELGMSARAEALTRPVDVSSGVDVLSTMADEAEAVRELIAETQDERARMEDRRRAADADFTAARDRSRSAEETLAAAQSQSNQARTQLNTTRDELSALTPPAISENDIAAAWEHFVSWAQARTDDLGEEVASLSVSSDKAGATAELLEKELAAADTAASEANDNYTTAALAEQRTQTALDTAGQRKTDLTQRLSDAPSSEETSALLDQVKALQDAVDQASAALDEARMATSKARNALSDVESAITASWQQLRRVRDPLARFGAPEIAGTDLSADWQLIVKWSASEAESRLAQAEAAARLASDADERASAAQEALIDGLTGRGIAVDADLTTVDLCMQAPSLVASSVATAKAALERAQERLDESKQMRRQMQEAQEAQEAAEVARTLANYMRSNQFPRWLMASALDALLQDASRILFELSVGQFQLTRAERDLQVVDHNDADMLRPVKTLSGGETFQASLALALALSEQVTLLSTAGANKLESIFLDEGFGTLDEATLDVVAGTLENLASSGSRMVGVITHVPALAERIPVRFEVIRDGAGSHVERQQL